MVEADNLAGFDLARSTVVVRLGSIVSIMAQGESKFPKGATKSCRKLFTGSSPAIHNEDESLGWARSRLRAGKLDAPFPNSTQSMRGVTSDAVQASAWLKISRTTFFASKNFSAISRAARQCFS